MGTMRQLTDDERSNVYAVKSEKDCLTHSIWRNGLGEVMTQCGKMVVTATGFVRNGWQAAYPGNPAMCSHACRDCRRAM